MGNALLKPRNNTLRLSDADKQRLRDIVAEHGWEGGRRAIGVSIPTLQTLESGGKCGAAAVARCVEGLTNFEKGS